MDQGTKATNDKSPERERHQPQTKGQATDTKPDAPQELRGQVAR
jgi:hypothetical protein